MSRSMLGDNSCRIHWNGMSYLLITQRNGTGSRRYHHGHGASFESVYAHARTWKKRVEREDKREGYSTTVQVMLNKTARDMAIGTAGRAS